ncbi:hypothetical protein TYRP_023154 [Tyrophagus putrescentiae]|nr:hypothetical protein TYRP_023154 [Tyrophagus putrescentiae]
MEIPVTTTTASSSSLGDQTVSDSPNSLTTQPPEMLTQIADCLPLTEQLRLRGQVGNHRLFNFITDYLAKKKSLKLDITYKTRLSTDQNLSELVVCRAAVRRIVKQQQQEPPNPSNRKPSSSSSVFKPLPLWEKVNDNFMSQVAIEKWKKEIDEKKMYAFPSPQTLEKAYEISHGYLPWLATAFRRTVGFQPRLLPSLDNFVVVAASTITNCMDMAAAALAALLHSPHKSSDKVENDNNQEETDHQSSPILLNSFAFYAITFDSTSMLMSFLARLYKILSTTEIPPVPSLSGKFPTTPMGHFKSLRPQAPFTTPNSSLKSLKSLTLVSFWPFGDNLLTMADLEKQWRSGPHLCDPLSCLPIFPAVEELVLGGIENGMLAFLLSSSGLFPALQRLVLVFHSKETDAVKPVISSLQCISAECRRQLTALSVYSFDGLLKLHRRESDREAKEAAKSVKKNEDQEEKEDETEVVSLALSDLLAYVKNNFPKVERFNGQPL